MEERLLARMNEINEQIKAAGPGKDTVAKIAKEFRVFRVLVYKILGTLRRQISECCKCSDEQETRHRRKDLVFMGIPKVKDEDCSKVVLEIINTRLQLNLPLSAIKASRRLGASTKDLPRPILVRFTTIGNKALVWRAKTGLRGSKISAREFLTRSRQELFVKARHHFGMRACWTQDGNIFLKTADGTKHKVKCSGDLSPLLSKYSKVVGVPKPAAGRGEASAVSLVDLFVFFFLHCFFK
ncbi:unnamed protein product [Spodoptera littoralis]|uniref:Uncharacterized protein n=1 Tax=Spodoptera littoralis TaxID=7109 RepID=A0A9P0IGH9_SPOLI|nr:unnamed protein product [Spodoptera littoralis]CAH1647340.1 unnamed protein product [Spodoptera littoralis]